jgi:hypothetical protein
VQKFFPAQKDSFFFPPPSDFFRASWSSTKMSCCLSGITESAGLELLPWIAGPVSYPLDHEVLVEIISRLSRKFCLPSPCCLLVSNPNCWSYSLPVQCLIH